MNRKLEGVSGPPESPDSPSGRDPSPERELWTALANKEDIFAIAYRLGLDPAAPVESWRLAALRIARSDAFMEAKPAHVYLALEDWERWRLLEESPRKMLDLLRKLVYGVRIWA